MDLLKINFAKKLLALRTGAGMTQSELGEKLNYSDKTVSKWERGEAIPDAAVLKNISRIFSVSIDFLLDDETPVDEADLVAKKDGTLPQLSLYPSITRVILAGIWTAAALLFVLLWIIVDVVFWQVFIYALPITALAMLIFNSIWNEGRGNFWIVSFQVISLLVAAYVGVLPLKNSWQLFLLVLPAELLVYLAFRIKKRRK